MRIKLLVTGLLLMGTAILGAEYRDGTYRGFYGDQVEVEFRLKDDIVTDAKYRNLYYKGTDYRKSSDAGVAELKEEYQALLHHLVGKDIKKKLDDLYSPGDIQMAGATIRSNKVRSAIQDGLNRGAYNLSK